MRLKRFDLNLLVVLDALLREQNTTRAGKRINLSQPAVSLALARLRDYFKDDLLTQVGRNLVPTPLGLSLAKPVRDILLQSEAALQSRPAFDPKHAERKFILMMSDFISVVLLSEFVKRIERLAPGIQFEVLPHSLFPYEAVGSGEVDLLIMPQEYLPPDHPSEILFEDHYVCVMWVDNPVVGKRITREQYLSLGHVLARPGGGHLQRRPTVDESFFQQLGSERRIEMVVGEFTVIPQYLIHSSRIATMHARLAQVYARQLPLRIVPLPFECPTVNEAMCWHKQRSQDLGLAWLRQTLKETAQRLESHEIKRSR